MRRGTTPTHTFKVGIDLSDIQALFITYQQNGETVVEKTIDDVEIDAENKVIRTTLSQADTLLFESEPTDRCCAADHTKDNKVKVQIRIKFADGSATASNTMVTTVDEILKDGEI